MLHRKKILTYAAILTASAVSIVAFQNCGGNVEMDPPTFETGSSVDLQDISKASTFEALARRGPAQQGASDLEASSGPTTVANSERYTDAIATCQTAHVYPPDRSANIVSGKEDLYLFGGIGPAGSKVVDYHWEMAKGPSNAVIAGLINGGSTVKVQGLKYGVYVFKYTITYLVRPGSEITRESSCTHYDVFSKTQTDYAVNYTKYRRL